MSQIKKHWPVTTLAIFAIIAFGSIFYLASAERVAGEGGAGYEGRQGIVDIIGTKANPTQGATSTSANNSGCDSCQTVTSTQVIYLQNADTITLNFDMTPTTTVSSFNWYFEVSNAADCEVDGPWSIRATSTEMVGVDFNTTPGNATPTDSLIPGIDGRITWNQTISNLNYSCLRVTGSFASSTDDSSIHVSASLK